MIQNLENQENIYSGARGLAIKILNRIDRTDAYLDKLLDYEFKHKELSDLDKGLLSELVHGVVRWKNRLDWVLNGFYHGTFTKVETNLKNALRVAVYQILFLDKIPHFAAVNEAVEFVKRVNGEKAANLVNAVLRNIIRNITEIKYPDPDVDQVHYLSVYYSHPPWLVKRWLSRYGFEETKQLLIANNQIPDISIRINKLKIEPASFLKLLDEVTVPYSGSKYIDYFIRVKNLNKLIENKYFENGYFSIQDESAALPSILLDPKPGETIIDLCASPGGKSTHMAELMQNKGKIIAVDKYSHKLNLLKKNFIRLGIEIIEPVTGDATDISLEPADKVLLDVPCSGLGVLRKKPDVKWKRDLKDILNLSEYQLRILSNAAGLVKTGGVIVYSTCTTEPEENIDVVRKFLEQNANFKLESAENFVNSAFLNSFGCVETIPHKHDIDGSFAARLLKTS
ncbi:MAG: Ribosomal RNA small subunit methyltransferase B [Ignavibacteriae bacterium]|nr:MAG: Ribosomal RNA small subunit methyltransferase B [Ignavibacteriota bacterium]